MHLTRSVLSPLTPAEVFAFISDFETTEQWDPGTVSTQRLAGDGGVGTSYRNISQFRGKQSELIYTVTEFEPGVRFALRGEGRTIVADDCMVVTPTAEGTRLDYDVRFRLRGALRPFTAALGFFKADFEHLADEGQRGLSQALGSGVPPSGS